ncbi:MAG TPA: MarR family transcriptional regulator [Geothrix sp.]|nr:MarR family transcriptional regulator [Geothrix sp.]
MSLLRKAGIITNCMGSQPESTNIESATRRILQAFRSIVRELRLTSASTEKAFGITTAQLFVLRALHESPGTSLGVVAERTATDQSSVSVVVRKLEEKKLLKKRVSGEDRRRLEIFLTPAGERLSQMAPPTVQENLIQRIASLGSAERNQLANLLERCALPEDESQPMFFEEQPAGRRKGHRKA